VSAKAAVVEARRKGLPVKKTALQLAKEKANKKHAPTKKLNYERILAHAGLAKRVKAKKAAAPADAKKPAAAKPATAKKADAKKPAAAAPKK
jgi:hypothetical protein